MAHFKRLPIQVEAVRFDGTNFDELDDFCGKRNVETESNPLMVPVFNKMGTYLGRWYHPEAIAEVWVESEEKHRPVYAGRWVAKVQGTPGVVILLDDGTRTAPLCHEPDIEHSEACIRWRAHTMGQRKCICSTATKGYGY